MAWDYAELSKQAKASGGPEKLMKIVASSNRRIGNIQMIPAVILSLVVGAVAGGPIINKASAYLSDKKAKKEAQAQAAKDELVEGIKEYDAEHPEDSEKSPTT